MGTEESRAIVLKFVASMASGRDMSLVADDCTWWVPGRGDLSIEEFSKLGHVLRGVLAGPFNLEIQGVTAENDRVAVECQGEGPLIDGRTYRNSYHFLFKVKDGLIREIHEHNNSLIPHLLFGDRLPPLPELEALGLTG